MDQHIKLIIKEEISLLLTAGNKKRRNSLGGGFLM